MGLGHQLVGAGRTLEMTREQIEQAPEYDPDQIIDRPFEERLHEHYRRPGYWR
jgi:stress response protein YsnF